MTGMNRTAQRRSDAMLYSLSEFAYILLFLSMGAAVLLYGRSVRAEREAEELTVRVAELQGEVEELTTEVNFLNELLAEKRYGVVPCWKRPEGVVPPVAGTVTINFSDEFVLKRNSSGRAVTVRPSYDERKQVLEVALSRLFASDLAYAESKNCYLRVTIENNTGSFHIYSDVLDVLGSLGFVVVTP